MPSYAYMKEWKKKRYDAGICMTCDNLREPDKRLCASCSYKRNVDQKEQRINKFNKNICWRCGATRLENSPLCLDCWFKKMAYKNGYNEDSDQWISLKNLFDKQGGRCAYTGNILIPGVNASVDHIIPKAKGGTSNIENLQWVALKVNSFKNKNSHKDFIEMCLKVAKHYQEQSL